MILLHKLAVGSTVGKADPRGWRNSSLPDTTSRRPGPAPHPPRTRWPESHCWKRLMNGAMDASLTRGKILQGLPSEEAERPGPSTKSEQSFTSQKERNQNPGHPGSCGDQQDQILCDERRRSQQRSTPGGEPRSRGRVSIWVCEP